MGFLDDLGDVFKAVVDSVVESNDKDSLLKLITLVLYSDGWKVTKDELETFTNIWNYLFENDMRTIKNIQNEINRIKDELKGQDIDDVLSEIMAFRFDRDKLVEMYRFSILMICSDNNINKKEIKMINRIRSAFDLSANELILVYKRIQDYNNLDNETINNIAATFDPDLLENFDLSEYSLEDNSENQQLLESDMIECHNCGSQCQKTINFCPACGCDLRTRVCSKCSSENSPVNAFCGNCGNKF